VDGPRSNIGLGYGAVSESTDDAESIPDTPRSQHELCVLCDPRDVEATRFMSEGICLFHRFDEGGYTNSTIDALFQAHRDWS